MKRVLLPFAVLMLLQGCEVIDLFVPAQPAISGDELVIEGWIDEGGYPVVSVMSTLLRPDDPQYVKGLMSLVAKEAEVTVSDGTRTWQLSGAYNLNYFPPYVFSTQDVKGEAGKTYTLSVKYKGLTATAETSIPPKTELDSCEIIEMDDGILRIYATFTPEPDRCYGFFSKGSEDQFGYTPVFLGFIDGASVSGPQTVSVTRGSGLTAIKDYKPGYQPGETVSIRFCTMDPEMYRFWKMFEDVTGVSYIATYPTSFDNLPSNVSGAYGYWAGYGTTVYSVTLPEVEE